MVVNFRTYEISRGASKLTQTPTLIIYIYIDTTQVYMLIWQLEKGESYKRKGQSEHLNSMFN